MELDTYSIKELLGVCSGICPLNFPTMIPLKVYCILQSCLVFSYMSSLLTYTIEKKLQNETKNGGWNSLIFVSIHIIFISHWNSII